MSEIGAHLTTCVFHKHSDPTDTVDMPAATETPQKRKVRSDRSKSKGACRPTPITMNSNTYPLRQIPDEVPSSTGKKKAGAPSQENDTRNENVHVTHLQKTPCFLILTNVIP